LWPRSISTLPAHAGLSMTRVDLGNRKPSQPHWHVCLAQETADAIAHVLAGVA
jgi:hypothetical protein